VGWGKVACWSTKVAISLKRKRVKIEEKLLWKAYRNSPTFFRTVPSPTPYDLLFPRIGGSQLSQNLIAIIYGPQIWLVHSQGLFQQKAHLKFWRKGSVGVSRDCPNFLIPPIISGGGLATNFEFCTHIHRTDRNINPLKFSGKVAVGVLRDSRKFSGHHYIWRIARSPCDSSAFLFCYSSSNEAPLISGVRTYDPCVKVAILLLNHAFPVDVCIMLV